ncbi:dihydrodipicolinate synthase family protein [Halobaculum halobium]|uniref:Dihydrodipicolinate synthase family protein n=1 Tax=Halobaculum halobium TaxID=3032281 RepID=A0ABD5TB44_9EURY|nr:dihydrodipicolinate synthase family protein [Halobaculum sp. SYNS20]
MHGTGPPLVTPFDADGALDVDALRDLVDWVEARGIDFLVPCGSNSEAELMAAEERARVIEVVADAASVPVLAGTGSPGKRETLEATAAAADAGADAALVVTPFYYDHDQATLETYYREVADESPVPVYLYSVPVFTDASLDPETVGRLAAHPNVAGMKDSSGDIAAFQRIRERTATADFDLMVGSGGVLGQALAAGGTGGVLALANIAPEATAAIYEASEAGDRERARELTAACVDLNHAITAEYGIPGLKYAMRQRGAPAGHARSPHRAPEADARAALDELLGDLDDLLAGV